MLAEVIAGSVWLLLMVYYRSLRVWRVHGRCAHWVRYVGNYGLCHFEKLSRINVHIANAMTCSINSWRFWLDERRPSTIIACAMVRGVGYSDEGSVDRRQPRARQLWIRVANENLHTLFSRQFIAMRHRVPAGGDESERQLLMNRI